MARAALFNHVSIPAPKLRFAKGSQVLAIFLIYSYISTLSVPYCGVTTISSLPSMIPKGPQYYFTSMWSKDLLKVYVDTYLLLIHITHLGIIQIC